MVSFSKLAVIALASSVYAVDGVGLYTRAELAYMTCLSVLTKLATLYGKADKKGYCDIHAQQALGSMAHCLADAPHTGGVKYFLEHCAKYNLTEDDVTAAYNNATEYLVKNVTAYPGFDKSELFYLPVKVPTKKLTVGFLSAETRYLNYNYANIFGWVLVLYWFLIMFVVGIFRALHFMAPKFMLGFHGRITNTFRRHVTLPAFVKKRIEPFTAWGIIHVVVPSRLETILVFVYFVLVLAFNTSNIHHVSNNLYWTNTGAEMGRKIADRTGIMVLYIIPQLVLFAGRNNFMRFVTGWSFARFNILHRWMARISFLLMIAHAVGMTYNGIGAGKYQSRNATPYVRWGYVALVGWAIMCVHSLGALRKNNYEGFVLAHNILGAIVVAGTWIHVRDDDFHTLMIAASAVWCFDKFVRLVRMAYFGVRTADVQLVANETLLVRVPGYRFAAHALCHAYIYFFRALCFWQSHPFSPVQLADGELSFYIKVKGGMTSSLCRYLATQPEQRAKIRCSVEGPYGARYALQHYKAISYLGGGNGIPGLYASASELARKNTGQTLKLYWAVRHWQSIEWFYRELQTLRGLNVQTVIYVSQFDLPLDRDFDVFSSSESSDNTHSDTESGEEKEKDPISKQEALMRRLDFIEFRAGRPDLTSIIPGDESEASGAVAVVTCGHSTFADQSCELVCANLSNEKRVDIYELNEVW